MSHAIETFGHVGQKAWHGLGWHFKEGTTVREAQPFLRLDRDPQLLPMRYEEPGMQSLDYWGDAGEVDGFQAIVWDSRVLGVVSDDYSLFGNTELVRLAETFGEWASFETGGILNKGRTAFILMHYVDPWEVRPGDKMVPYVLLVNSHDGRSKLCVYSTTMRVVCLNTLRASSRDLLADQTATHRGDITGRAVEIASLCKERHAKAQEELWKKTQVLTAQRSDWRDRSEILLDLFGERLLDRFDAKLKQGDDWTFFNNVTSYLDHEAKTRLEGRRLIGLNEERKVRFLAELAK